MEWCDYLRKFNRSTGGMTLGIPWREQGKVESVEGFGQER